MQQCSLPLFKSLVLKATSAALEASGPSSLDAAPDLLLQAVQTSATAADGDFLLVIVRCLPSFIVMFNDTQVSLHTPARQEGWLYLACKDFSLKADLHSCMTNNVCPLSLAPPCTRSST